MRLQRLASHFAAFIFAALTPAAFIAGMAGSIQLLPITFVAALAHALALGLPLYAIFRLKQRVNLVTCIGSGFFVAALPVGVIAWPWGAGSDFSINEVPMIVGGIPTAAGWFNYFKTIVAIGSFGGLGGFAFWSALMLTGETIDWRQTGLKSPKFTSTRVRQTTWALLITHHSPPS